MIEADIGSFTQNKKQTYITRLIHQELIWENKTRNADMLKIIKGSNGWEFIDVSESDLDKAISYIETRPVKTSLYLNAATCGSEMFDRILCHKKNSVIRSLHLMDSWSDVRAFENFSQLETLNFGYENSKFDFSRMPKLKEITGIWSPHWTGLDICFDLEKFAVSKYKRELVDIPQISQLKKISLLQPALKTLKGIECAESLNSLEIILARNLVNIDDISQCKNTLKELSFDSCKKIESFECIGDLVGLDILLIAECVKIDSISFIREIRNLKVLSIFETKVLDNDLSVCINHPSLRELRSFDRKSYIPRVGEVKEQLACRKS